MAQLPQATRRILSALYPALEQSCVQEVVVGKEKIEMETKKIETGGSLDYSYFINTHSSRRRPLLTRELTKHTFSAPKESISLAEGMPNEATFPFEKLQVQLKDGTSLTLKGKEIGTALQYIPTQGYPPLLKTLKDFTRKIHDPPNWDQTEVLMTNGSQDGISRAIELCVEEGDLFIVQNPLYTGTEIILKPYKAELVPVDQDGLGMIPEELERTLEDLKTKGRKMPKMMYINPTGSNPTGTTLPLERRQRIYDICCKYNIIILEDDAYYFMNFSNELVPSFLSLDTEGRVLRFDSLSKVLSSGLRVGWVTGPKTLIQNIELHIQSSYLHSSTLSQVLVNSLFTKWGYDRILEHMAFVKEYYRVRRDLTLQSMETHLKDLCEWEVPSGGMFVWIKVKEISDVYDMLLTRGIKKHITFVPGHAFMADPTKACNYIRASYSKASPKQIDTAFKLLADLIREEKVLLRRKLENFT